jgi:hypothetical protein
MFPFSFAPAPWAISLATGQPLPAFTGTGPGLTGLPIPLPSPGQWASMSPIEQQAVLGLAAMTMGSPQFYLWHFMQSLPPWGPLPGIMRGFAPTGGFYGTFAR